MLKLFDIHTIRGKFILQTMILTVLPMIVLSSLFYYIALNKLRDNANYFAETSLRAANSYLTRTFNDLDELMDVVRVNDTVQQLLSAEVVSEEQYLSNYKIINKITDSIIETKDYIQSYVIYGTGEQKNFRFYRGITTAADPYILESNYVNADKWVNYLKKQPSRTLFHSNSFLFNSFKNNNYFYASKLIHQYVDNYHVIGLLVVVIDKKKFFNDIELLTSSPDSNVMVLDPENVIMDTSHDYRSPLMNEVVHAMSDRQHSGKFTMRYNRVNYSVFYAEEPVSKWKIIHFTESVKLFEKDADSIRNSTIVIFFLMLFLGILLALRFGNMISKPLRKLHKLIKQDGIIQSDNGDFDEKDEVGQIGILYIRLKKQNQFLNDEIVNELIKRNEAEIQALQSQINPHFLYNTLESLNWLAISNKQMLISEIIGALGDFFRIAISKGSTYIPIAKEIDHVHAYMIVQRFRYKDKIELIIEVNEQVMGYYIPKFIFQPIVENCIYHGLKPTNVKGTIMLTGDRVGDSLEFQITDDGIGMSEEQLTELRAALDVDSWDQAYGLRNVHRRLKLQFGDLYGIRIVSQPGQFTSVIITIPILTENEVTTRYGKSSRSG
ncbi:sensor histidine kinase [Paenibacillus nasutitermitis]|nr:histidine kinase [Paenibacillus nasutitermitis]